MTHQNLSLEINWKLFLATLNDVKNTNKELRTELEAAKRKISQQRDEIDEQYHGLDDLEQYSRKNSLEIVGIPESIRENE